MQVCADCNGFNGLSCPSGTVCCASGRCAATPTACACSVNTDCPLRHCCSAVSGKCTQQVLNAAGELVCANCNTFNGLACPAFAPVCCPQSGACIADATTCPCYWWDGNSCPTGYGCADGECSTA